MSGDKGDGPPRRPRRLVVVTLAVALVVGAAVLHSQWWSRPDAFDPVGGGFTFDPFRSPRPVTAAMVSSTSDADAETVTVTRAVPRVVTNTARAEITVVRCTTETVLVTAPGAAERVCESVGPVEGPLRLEPGSLETIAVTIEPRRTGRVVVRGLRVEYHRGARHLWQRGSQATGLVIKLRVDDRPPAVEETFE